MDIDPNLNPLKQWGTELELPSNYDSLLEIDRIREVVKALDSFGSTIIEMGEADLMIPAMFAQNFHNINDLPSGLVRMIGDDFFSKFEKLLDSINVPKDPEEREYLFYRFYPMLKENPTKQLPGLVVCFTPPPNPILMRLTGGTHTDFLFMSALLINTKVLKAKRTEDKIRVFTNYISHLHDLFIFQQDRINRLVEYKSIPVVCKCINDRAEIRVERMLAHFNDNEINEVKELPDFKQFYKVSGNIEDQN